MEIELRRDGVIGSYDSGGGCRDIKVIVFVADNLHPRLQRKVAIFETLGACLGYCINRESREDISDLLVDVLDQLEPL